MVGGSQWTELVEPPCQFEPCLWGNTGVEKAQGVLVVERRDCSFGKGEATFIKVVERAQEVQKRVQMW